MKERLNVSEFFFLINLLNFTLAVIAQDNKNCFTEAYKSLALTDLIISPKGADNGETVCSAAKQAKSWYPAQDPAQSSENLFWGAQTLDTAVGTDGIWFSASSCGITPGPKTVGDGPSAKEYMQFSTTIMSQFSNTPKAVLTHVS